MQQADYLKDLYQELAAYGITQHSLITNRGKHPQLRWWHNSKSYVLTLASTPSDRRARLNARATLRRQMKDANIPALPVQNKQRTRTSTADGSGLQEEFQSLRLDVNELTEMLLDCLPSLQRFDSLATKADQETAEGICTFQVRAEIPGALVGLLLSFLVKSGVSLKNVRIGTMPVPTVQPERAPEPIPFPTYLPEPNSYAVKKKGARPPFGESKLGKLLLFMRNNGPTTLDELRAAGFTGYKDNPKTLSHFVWTALRKQNLGERTDYGTWKLGPGAIRILEEHGL